jgi:hypothetical protein
MWTLPSFVAQWHNCHHSYPLIPSPQVISEDCLSLSRKLSPETYVPSFGKCPFPVSCIHHELPHKLTRCSWVAVSAEVSLALDYTSFELDYHTESRSHAISRHSEHWHDGFARPPGRRVPYTQQESFMIVEYHGLIAYILLLLLERECVCKTSTKKA